MTTLSTTTFIGFHTYNSFINATGAEDDIVHGFSLIDYATKAINLINLLGYVPIGGLATAYERIQLQLKNDNHSSLSRRIYSYVRAFFEALGCGLIFLPIDLTISLHRHIFVSGPTYPEPNPSASYLYIFKDMEIFRDLNTIFFGKQERQENQ